MTIQNNSDHILQVSSQQAIENAAVNAGIDNVIAVRTNENEDSEQPIYDIYDEEAETYQFSIDTDGDVIFER